MLIVVYIIDFVQLQQQIPHIILRKLSDLML